MLAQSPIQIQSPITFQSPIAAKGPQGADYTEFVIVAIVAFLLGRWLR